ncbi:MAG TPA: phytoene desaturase family protein [Gemmatimonadaceae bacterium]|nr:phytoene desaturase family protein [Gemmatimonadaceae bacterium]
MRIVGIGAGFGGLAAAIRLQAQGHRVTLVEKLDRPGGRAYVFEQDGFTFDAGPTIITAPWMLQELFECADRRLEDYVELVRLDPAYHVRFEDGSVFRYVCEENALETEVRRFAPDDVAGYRRFSAISDDTFSRAMPLVDRPFHRFGTMFRAMPDLLRVRADRSVARVANLCFRDPRLRQVFSFHPLLIGGHPFETPAIYTLVHALEKRWGVWFAMGGMGKVVHALGRVFTELGGELLLEREVAQITLDASGKRASGVRLTNGELLTADAVVSNADVATTYLRLLPRATLRRNAERLIERGRYSMSVFMLYFGTARRYDEMAQHEILMGPRYRGLLDDVFHGRRLADDFSLYLYRPTATDKSLAPDGCDSWYALSPVPNLAADIDWATEGPRYRDRIVQYLEARYMPNLSRHIVTERSIDPRYFRDSLGSHLGAAFSLTPSLAQSAWFRPHNVSEDIPNLYIVGAGTHPGAGVPGVLSSGRIVATMIGPACRGVPKPKLSATSSQFLALSEH